MGHGHIRHDPCLETVRRPTTAGSDRIRVVELLATGIEGVKRVLDVVRPRLGRKAA